MEQHSFSLPVGTQDGTASLEESLVVSHKTKHTEITLGSIYPKELKTYPQKTCIWMFIVALHIIAKIWKQQRCPLPKGWIHFGT